MVVPPKQPKMITFSRKPMDVGYHHFRKTLCTMYIPVLPGTQVTLIFVGKGLVLEG